MIRQTRHSIFRGPRDIGKRLLLIFAATAAVVLPLAIGRVHAAQSNPIAVKPLVDDGKRIEFDVASIKLNKLGVPPAGPPPMTNVDLDPGEIYAPTGGIFRVQNKSLRTLIAFAYKMNGNQQLYLHDHVPDFVLADRFDAEARTTLPNPTKDQVRLMVRSLLEDRFKLKVHAEIMQAPVFAMALAKPGKLGPQLRLHQANDPVCSSTHAPSDQAAYQPPPPDGFPPICGTIVGMMPTPTPGVRSMKIGGRNVSMALIATAFVGPYTGDTGLGHPVFDNTGLPGTFDFTLQLDYTDMLPTFTPDTSGLFLEELRDQLGIKLNKTTGPEDVYVVDHVERLTAN